MCVTQTVYRFGTFSNGGNVTVWIACAHLGIAYIHMYIYNVVCVFALIVFESAIANITKGPFRTMIGVRGTQEQVLSMAVPQPRSVDRTHGNADNGGPGL